MDNFHGQFSWTLFMDNFHGQFSWTLFMDTFFTHPQLKTTVSTCKGRRSVVCKALIAWIMTHKLLLPSLPRSLQSCQSRYTHGILILVKDHMFLLAEKLMLGGGKTLFSLSYHNHGRTDKVDTLMEILYWLVIYVPLGWNNYARCGT